jgi:hypothetical protein
MYEQKNLRADPTGDQTRNTLNEIPVSCPETTGFPHEVLLLTVFLFHQHIVAVHIINPETSFY